MFHQSDLHTFLVTGPPRGAGRKARPHSEQETLLPLSLALLLPSPLLGSAPPDCLLLTAAGKYKRSHKHEGWSLLVRLLEHLITQSDKAPAAPGQEMIGVVRQTRKQSETLIEH